MVEVDYIVVGLGLAGMAFCEQLSTHNKKFLVIDNGGPSASRVSGGVYNPVILKRYTLPWEAEQLMDVAVPYYERLTKKLGIDAMHPTPVLRLFSSAEDQNNWFEALGKPGLSRFLSPKLQRERINGVESTFHYGKILETGRIDVPAVLDAYKAYLIQNKQWLDEVFEYDQIVIEDDQVVYKNYRARFIVFAEGYGVKKKPVFR